MMWLPKLVLKARIVKMSSKCLYWAEFGTDLGLEVFDELIKLLGVALYCPVFGNGVNGARLERGLKPGWRCFWNIDNM